MRVKYTPRELITVALAHAIPDKTRRWAVAGNIEGALTDAGYTIRDDEENQ